MALKPRKTHALNPTLSPKPEALNPKHAPNRGLPAAEKDLIARSREREGPDSVARLLGIYARRLRYEEELVAQLLFLCRCRISPSTLNPQPKTLNPKPSTLNPEPSSLKPQASTLKPSLPPSLLPSLLPPLHRHPAQFSEPMTGYALLQRGFVSLSNGFGFRVYGLGFRL